MSTHKFVSEFREIKPNLDTFLIDLAPNEITFEAESIGKKIIHKIIINAVMMN